MKLTKTDADLYFDLMWKLQWYVNQERQIISPVKSPAKYAELDMEDKAKVRDFLFDNFIPMVQAFTQTNPFDLDTEQLQIIQTWEKYIPGTFFIERLLKKHAIFIHNDTNLVYGVLGLYEPLSEIIDPRSLPVCIDAILLPFQGKIIYDGLFRAYPLLFGSGIRGELKQLYLEAKQNQNIITNLEVEKKPNKVKVLASVKDWQPEIQELISKAKKLRGGSGQPAVYSPIFSLIKLSLDLADKATLDSLDLDYFYRKVERFDALLSQIENQLHKMDR